MTYEINEKWDFGLVFVFGTGNAVAMASQYYSSAVNPMKTTAGEISIETVPYYKKTNGYRMPAYHRMDIGFNSKYREKMGNSTCRFSI